MVIANGNPQEQHLQVSQLESVSSVDDTQVNNKSQPQQETKDDTHCLALVLELCFVCLCLFFLLVLCVVFVCIVSVVVLAITLILFAIVPVMLMSLLVAFLLVVRILQLLRSGDDYYRTTHVKSLIRFLMCICTALFLIPLGIFSIIANTNPTIKHMTLSGLSITNWINATAVVCGFYLLSFGLFTLGQYISPPLSWQYDNCINITQAVYEIIDCLVFWWAASTVMKCVPPSFKQHQILGLHIQKWIEVLTFVLIGINIVAICCHGINYLLQELYGKLDPVEEKSTRHYWVEKVLRRKYVVYWANGLTSSIIFIFSSMLLLLTCTLYFGSHLNATPQAKNALLFGTWFCASLLILAFLWLIKSCILLTWKANQVHTRLSCRILENVEELYFLGILGRRKYDIFNLRGYSREPVVSSTTNEEVKEKNPTPNEEVEVKIPIPNEEVEKKGPTPTEEVEEKSPTPKEEVEEKSPTPKEKKLKSIFKFILHSFEKFSAHTNMSAIRDNEDDEGRKNKVTPLRIMERIMHPKMRKRVKQDMLMHKGHNDRIVYATLHDLHQMAQYFLAAQPTLSIDTYASDILQCIKDSAHERSFKENVEHQIKGKTTHPENEDWDSFKRLLNNVPGNDEISEAILGNWLEKEHRTCLSLANTLCSAKEVVDCLNNIIGGLLIAATVIVWLLLTGLATTKILLLIASPTLAATFIFGDTCKSLFQGIIFAYVLHPFNVGDLCIIDDKMMEVKRLGVWKTIFVVIGNHEEVIYPNSELAIKKIINHKSEFDMNDCLEFNLRCLQSEKIKALETDIKNYLSKEAKCIPNHFSIEVMTAEEDVKMIVQLKYKIHNQHGMTFYECLQEKKKLRFDFSIGILNLVNQYRSK